MLLMRLQINVPRRSYSRFWTRATSRLTYYSPRSFSRHFFDPSAFTLSFILMDEPFVGSVNASFKRRRWISWSTFYFHRFGWQRDANAQKKKTTKIASFIIHYKHWFSEYWNWNNPCNLAPNLPLNFSK